MSYYFVYTIKRNLKLTVVTQKNESENDSVHTEEAPGTTSSHEFHRDSEKRHPLSALIPMPL